MTSLIEAADEIMGQETAQAARRWRSTSIALAAFASALLSACVYLAFEVRELSDRVHAQQTEIIELKRDLMRETLRSSLLETINTGGVVR